MYILTTMPDVLYLIFQNVKERIIIKTQIRLDLDFLSFVQIILVLKT